MPNNYIALQLQRWLKRSMASVVCTDFILFMWSTVDLHDPNEVPQSNGKKLEPWNGSVHTNGTWTTHMHVIWAKSPALYFMIRFFTWGRMMIQSISGPHDQYH